MSREMLKKENHPEVEIALGFEKEIFL